MDITEPANASATPSGDAHGQAAMLLIESLIHGLCDSGALEVGQAVEIVERARDVQIDYVDASDDASGSMRRSYDLLSNIAASLKTDDVSAPPKPRLVD